MFVANVGLRLKLKAAIAVDDVLFNAENTDGLCLALGANYTVLQISNGSAYELVKLECIAGALTLTRGQYGATALAWKKGECFVGVLEPCAVVDCVAPAIGVEIASTASLNTQFSLIIPVAGDNLQLDSVCVPDGFSACLAGGNIVVNGMAEDIGSYAIAVSITNCCGTASFAKIYQFN